MNQLDWIRVRYDICGYMLRWIRVCYGVCGYATIYAGTMHYFKFNFKPIKLKLVTLKHCAPYGNWLPLSKSVFKFSISSVVQKIRALQFNYGHFAKSQSRFAAGQVNAVLMIIRPKKDLFLGPFAKVFVMQLWKTLAWNAHYYTISMARHVSEIFWSFVLELQGITKLHTREVGPRFERGWLR